MGIEFGGFEELQANIRQIGPRAERAVTRQMRFEAYRMRDLARKFAPIDEGPLEEAIEVKEEGGGRDSRGRFARVSYTVYVDTDAYGSHGAFVGEYAYIMHEHLAPYGSYKLGKRSREKQSGQSEMVGGRYLERAAAEVSDGIMNRLIEVTRRELY
jgi:hypothetical protein